MRVSAKELTVRQYVKRKVAWRQTECSTCGDFIWLELMYHVPRLGDGTTKVFDPKLGRWVTNPATANFCSKCVSSKEDAFDLTFKYEVNAQDIVSRNQERYLRREKDRWFNEAIRARESEQNIVYEVLQLPDGEVSPSVHSILVKHITP